MAFTMSYIFQAVDKFSAPVNRIENKMKEVSATVSHVAEKMDIVNRKMEKLGAASAIFLGLPLVEIARESVKSYDEWQRSIAQVGAALKSTGGAAKLSVEQINKASEDLEMKSVYDHVDILNQVSVQLMRYRNISGDTFLRTQQAAVDYAARTKSSLQGAAVMIGRAINDPSMGIMRLARIITLTKKQREIIKELAESGRLAQAQNLILTTLEKSYGGAALTASKTGLAPFEMLNKEITRIKEQFGKLIANVLLLLVPKIQAVISAFKSLSPEAKKWIFIAISIIAVSGPLLLLIGALGMALSGLGVVIAILLSPVTGIIAALALMSFGFIKAYNTCKPFRDEVDDLTSKLKILWQWMSSIKNVGTNFLSDAHNATVGFLQKHSNIPLVNSLYNFANQPTSTQALSSHKSSVDINLNVNDKNGNIGPIQTYSKGAAQVNVGRNMAHV